MNNINIIGHSLPSADSSREVISRRNFIHNHMSVAAFCSETDNYEMTVLLIKLDVGIRLDLLQVHNN